MMQLLQSHSRSLSTPRRRMFVTAQQGSLGPSHAACHVAAYCRLFAPGAAAEGLGYMASIGRVVTDMQYR